MSNSQKWWQSAVFYQIYPRSFYDSNNDGIGDLKGIEEKIPYLVELGIDALWISPFYKSPMDDFGYDISDYRDIDSIFGNMADFKSMLESAHKAGIKIIVDLVVNHSSDQHPWFLEAKKSKDNPKHGYYIWKPVTSRRPPNNWVSLFEQKNAWHVNKATNEWFLGTFTKHQPEFDWRNPELRKEIFDIVRFWLDLGADGFRMDVATAYYKDEQFRSNPLSLKAIPDVFQHHIYDRNQPEFHEAFKEFRKITDSYKDKMLIGETHGQDSALAASCYGKNNDELHMAFNFDFLFRKWSASQFRTSAINWYNNLPEGAWPNFTLSNHDQFRHYFRYGKNGNAEEKARVSCAMLLSLRGTPFLYYGEEIGMTCYKIPKNALRDPLGISTWPLNLGRDPERTPMQWNDSTNAGFGKSEPWLPINPDYKEKNVEKQKQDSSSLWNYYHNLIVLRHNEKVLQDGELSWNDSPKDVLSYTRTNKDSSISVYLNFVSSEQKINIDGGKVIFGTHASLESSLENGNYTLKPFEVLLIKKN